MIGKILVILLIISVIGSIMEKIEKSKKKKETKNNNKNLYTQSQTNTGTMYDKNDIIMFAVAMQETLESMTGKMLTNQEVSGLVQNYRFAYENLNEKYI